MMEVIGVIVFVVACLVGWSWLKTSSDAALKGKAIHLNKDHNGKGLF
jgi:hypothetical protein